MKLGRPVKSKIRSNIIEILHYMGQGYGYHISKIYNEIFPKVTQRSIYYHLRKGISTKEINVYKVEQEKGDFSWGPMTEKIYYCLGINANPKGLPHVKGFLQKWKR